MKILIVRPLTRTAFQLGEYCARAFSRLGHEASIFNFRYGEPSFRGKVGFLESRLRLNRTIDRFKPNLVLVIKGDGILPETIINIKKKFKIPFLNYWIDDPLWINISSKISPCYDYFFTNDPRSVPVHQKAGCLRVHFLTFGCDPDIHRRVSLSKKEEEWFGSEVSFAGTIVPRREETLAVLTGFNLKIWGPAVSRDTGEAIKIRKREIDSSSPLFAGFTGREVWGEEMVKVFNGSNICLNIHSQGGAGTNMRTFEITGCGGFLLCEFRETLPELFRIGQEIVCFRNTGELKELVKYYLAHPLKREEIARKGQERVYREHTYKERMKEMLSLIQI